MRSPFAGLRDSMKGMFQSMDDMFKDMDMDFPEWPPKESDEDVAKRLLEIASMKPGEERKTVVTETLPSGGIRTTTTILRCYNQPAEKTEAKKP